MCLCCECSSKKNAQNRETERAPDFGSRTAIFTHGALAHFMAQFAQRREDRSALEAFVKSEIDGRTMTQKLSFVNTEWDSLSFWKVLCHQTSHQFWAFESQISMEGTCIIKSEMLCGVQEPFNAYLQPQNRNLFKNEAKYFHSSHLKEQIESECVFITYSRREFWGIRAEKKSTHSRHHHCHLLDVRECILTKLSNFGPGPTISHFRYQFNVRIAERSLNR